MRAAPARMQRWPLAPGLFACTGLLLAGVMLGGAQEPEAPPPAARGPAGRGNRGARGAAGTREFLGLGAAPDPAAAAKGAPLYKQNCGGCHGENARGGQAPNLVRSVAVLHDEKDEEIGPVIKNGRPQAGMPAFPNLSAEDIHNIAQFLKQQVELAANRGLYGQVYGNVRNQVTGDARKGEEFFNGVGGCNSCHSVTGDLAKIGSKYSQAAQMQAKFLWPAPTGPAKVTVVTASGQSVTGDLRRMDDFGVSLVDPAGGYHYWPRDRVQVRMEDKLAGHRALLPKYTDADIHNLTAYLVSLK
jgi:cytochrome c oxidase cbb3-type subunit III